MAKRKRHPSEPRSVDAKRGEPSVFDAGEIRVRLDDRTIVTHPADSIDYRRTTPRTRMSK